MRRRGRIKIGGLKRINDSIKIPEKQIPNSNSIPQIGIWNLAL